MMTFIRVAHLKATYGGWVLYRNGEFFASSFPTKAEAIKWAKVFCELNGLRICITK
jgi:hypothetical protein